MKKIIQILALFILLAGCSSLPNLNIPQLAPTPTAPRTETPIPAATTTPIPTLNLFATSTSTPLTFTPTVTSIGAELFTPTATATNFPTAAPTFFATAAPTYGVPIGAARGTYFTPQSVGFLQILISNSILYWNEGPCMPREVKISAFVDDANTTHKVILFMRLREKKNTLNFTDWGNGVMFKAENGSYNYNLRTFNLKRYYYFKEAWIEYQLVAYNDNLEEIGRTPIYDRNLTLARCQPV